MNPLWGHLIGVMILLLLVVFVGIWVWAWSPHHKQDFDQLAELPLHDEEHPP